MVYYYESYERRDGWRIAVCGGGVRSGSVAVRSPTVGRINKSSRCRAGAAGARHHFERLSFACIPVVWSRAQLDEGVRSWQSASERAADAMATSGKADLAVALASALVKTCRLIDAPHIAAPAMCSALVHGTVTSALYCPGLEAVHRASEWLLHGMP
jgi:hypothetical protein